MNLESSFQQSVCLPQFRPIVDNQQFYEHFRMLSNAIRVSCDKQPNMRNFESQIKLLMRMTAGIPLREP